MAKPKIDKSREERIDEEIIVDCYGEAERAMGWYYYLEDRLEFPFTPLEKAADSCQQSALCCKNCRIKPQSIIIRGFVL